MDFYIGDGTYTAPGNSAYPDVRYECEVCVHVYVYVQGGECERERWKCVDREDSQKNNAN